MLQFYFGFSRSTVAHLFTSLVDANQAELLLQFQDIVTTMIQTNRLQRQENERLEASFHRRDIDLSLAVKPCFIHLI